MSLAYVRALQDLAQVRQERNEAAAALSAATSRAEEAEMAHDHLAARVAKARSLLGPMLRGADHLECNHEAGHCVSLPEVAAALALLVKP